MTREEAKDFLLVISYKLGSMDVEYLTEKDGEKMLEAIEALEQTEPEKCSDSISRQAALREFTCLSDNAFLINSTIQRIVKNLPPVIPERNTGHWIIHSDDLFPSESTQECSECHEHQPLHWRCSDNYCPNCGAKMVEFQESEEKG